jgi:tetratricopeptide (TPR) repeat protein
MVAVADKQKAAGDMIGVSTSLSAAKEAAGSVTDPVSKANNLNLVAAAYARLEPGSEEIKKLLKDSAKAIAEIKDADAKIPALADLASYTGQYLKNADAAAAHLKTAEEAAAEVSLPGPRVANLMRVALAYEKLERPADAERVVTQALEFARSLAEPREQSDCLAEVGGALYSLKKAEEGKSALDEAQAAAAKIATDDSRAYALLHIAQKASDAGHKGEARKLLDEAKDVATKVTDGSVRTQLNEDIDSALNSL